MLALAIAALAAAAACSPMPQGVTSAIYPSSSAPAGCSSSHDGTFQITVVNVSSSSKRDLERRESDAVLTLSLSGGVLTDQAGRTGYIAANQQFQFDQPAQAGAIYTAGWSVCSNGSLALGGSTIFHQCYSGGFYNLYDESIGDQCNSIYIEVIGGGSSQATSAAVVVSQISDGQIQATSAAPIPVTQISDGQIQASSAAPIGPISYSPSQATSAAPIPVTQISDGQIQATSAAPVSPIYSSSQATSAAPIPVTQISDGQIQGPTGTGTAVSRSITPSNNATYTTGAPTQFTGAAHRPIAELAGLVGAGVLGLAFL